MGTGHHGGFGETLGCSRQQFVLSCKVVPIKIKIKLPPNDSQLCHIFGNRPGHLPDTPENRKKLEDLANDESKYVGDDKYGNSWSSQIEPDGSQTWVRFRDGIINEGGSNKKPRLWDKDTGLNNNPFKKEGDKKNPPRGTNNNDANEGKGPKNNGGNDK